MVFTDLIEIKKRGEKLSREQIEFFVQGVTSGEIPDYQISALLMAIVLKGMDFEETVNLTHAMINSGDVLEKCGIKGVCVDKHSTGGVSDSTSLVVVPVCLALGLKFAKLSGRGLGHTGGTIDKLESFTGFNVNLSAEQFAEQVNTVGGAISGQTENTVPADKKLYALRDVTATVDSIPLIASSIMSKKLASFADVIVLDVKYGSGAFMKTAERAEELADIMVKIGKASGRAVSAVVTSMEQPLGDTIGCNAEVRGAIEILKGKQNDLSTVSFALAKTLLMAGGYSEAEAESGVKRVIENGEALEKLRQLVAAQGGDTSFIDDESKLVYGKYSMPILCEKGGFVSKINTGEVGNANVVLGGGRIRKEDEIDHESAIVMRVRLGDRVERGDVLATIYTNDEASLAPARDKMLAAFTVTEEYIKTGALIHNLIV